MQITNSKGTWSLSMYGTEPGPWYPASRGEFWHVFNIDTHQHKKMGPFRWRGVNHYDRAVAEANRRNRPTTVGNCPTCEKLIEMEGVGHDREGYEICLTCKTRVRLERKAT